MNKNLVSILIPFYKDKLSENETLSLRQCFKVLHKHPILAIKPQQLDESFLNEYEFSDIISFDNSFFQSIQGYNQLMLSDQFYKRFLDFEFILIYQLDAFVFRDSLTYWCNQGYDYVGAPWLNYSPNRDLVKRKKEQILNYIHTRYNIHIDGLPSRRQMDNRVGNGGFSLRKVRRFYDLCSISNRLIDIYNQENGQFYNEDIFWGIEMNRKKKNLNIPSAEIAVQFSFESQPENAFLINGENLPFGCHAWEKYPVFWQPIFKELGLTIS